MNIKVLFVGATLAVLGAGAPLAASAATVNYDFSGASPLGAYNAQFSLDVVGGQAISGTGDISGAGIPGTQDLTLITLATSGVEVDGGGLLGYRSNDGTDIFDADTSAPIDSNGLIFAIGPNAPQAGKDALYTVWDNGGGSFQTFFTGTVSAGSDHFYGYGTAAAGAVPEPAAWAMMLVGFGGLGAAMRQRRKPAALAA